MKELTLEKPLYCPCCGVELNYGIYRHESIPSVDRIDNAKGYVRGNVAIICLRCNSLKRDATLADVKNIVAYMERHGVK